MLVNENYSKPEEVAELYAALSGFYEKINNSESALTCIQKVKTIYEELYSPEDKRVIKARRKIATALLKSERYKEAVTELLEISKLEEKVFGETVQLARTLKLLGTVYSSLGIGDSKVYLKRAMNIFTASGNKKQAM
jgi:tetratricopeptide (TPR) repeat protein